MASRRTTRWRLALVSGVVALLGGATAGAQSPQGAPGASDECLACHTESIDRTFPDGSTRTLHVGAGVIGQSVHKGLECLDCHPAQKELPHPELNAATDRQFEVALAEQCRQCHFDEHRDTLGSVHARAVARGDLTAPVCIDCHGSHDVQRPSVPRTRIADTCGRCHSGPAATFARSVHGKDVARNVADVPTCTDCHGAHRIAGPDQPGWRSTTPEICGRCHGDPERMRPYGLSTNVLKTYLSDFHGKTASLRAATGESSKTVVAVCSDCHGTHDVERVDAAASPVLRANLTATCRQCHANASVTFPDAWMSHYEPDWTRTPMVMTVKTFYAVLIPFMIGGMMLQVLLHLWRMAVNR